MGSAHIQYVHYPPRHCLLTKGIIMKKDEQRIVFRQGKKVYLRPISKEDLPLLAVHINHQETVKNLTVTKPMSLEQEEQWFESIPKNTSGVVLAVVECETDELVGTVGLGNINLVNHTATTGFALRKKFWSKGYGTEAIILLLTYGFNTLNLRKINSSVYDFNEKSAKLHKKLGYKEEGVRRQQHYREGQYVDEIFFGLFKEDFFTAIKNLP